MSSLLPSSSAAPLPPPGRDDRGGAPQRRSRQVLVWSLRVALVTLAVLWSSLLLVWLVLHWGILPHIDRWRPDIERQASELVGNPVRIGSIEVRSESWVPSVEMRDVVLFDADGRQALVLPRVVAALASQSLFTWDVRLRQLYIDGARLDVRRDGQGRILVAGFAVDDSAEPDSAALRWLLRQPEVVVRGGSLRWTDEQRTAAPLELADVQLVLRSRLNRHAIRFDATPPAEWGERISVLGRFTQPLLDGADWRRWSGTLYADLPRADVRRLRQHLTLPVDISQGDGAMRAWLDVRNGAAVGATVDVALRAVTLQSGRDAKPLALEQIEGRLVAQRQDGRVRIEAQRLGFATADGLRWPARDLRLGWRHDAAGQMLGGELSAQELDLRLIARIASALPLAEATRDLLARTAPTGLVRELSVAFDGPAEAPTAYRASGRVEALALAAGAIEQPDAIARPGVRGLAANFKATERGGSAKLQMKAGELSFPGIFKEPAVPFDRLDADVEWRIEPAAGGKSTRMSTSTSTSKSASTWAIAVQVPRLEFANADAAGSLKARWSQPAGRREGSPGVLELDGRLSRGAAKRTVRYLPLAIDSEVRDWVAQAVQDGLLVDTRFRVKGDLDEFPFADKSRSTGEFRIATRVDGLRLAYMPAAPATASAPAGAAGWPAMTQLNADLVFDRAAMQIRNGQALIGDVRLDQLQADIADLENARLLVKGHARGPGAAMLRFVEATPVGTWTDHVLQRASLAGEAELRLALDVPLATDEDTRVEGSVLLAGNDVQITPETPPLVNARGRVDFSEKGFRVVGASARLLGGEAQFEGGSQPDGAVRFSGAGTISAEGLRRTVTGEVAQRLAGAVSGQTTYRASVGLAANGHPEFSISSSLAGLAINLPAPVRKPAETTLPLRLESALVAGSTSAPVRDQLRIELGSLLNARYLREYPARTPAGDVGVPRVVRGGIGVNAPAPNPAAGVAAQLELGQVDADAWRKLFETVADTSASASTNSLGGYEPHSIALRADRLLIGERQFDRLVATISEAGGNWRANLEAAQLAGQVEYRPPRPGNSAAAAGRVQARLARLSLPKQDAERVESLLEQQPANLPSLDIVVDDFELRGKRLGRVEVEAVNRGGDGSGRREWRLTRLNLITPEARLTASGSWGDAARPGAPRRSTIDFALDLVDSGDFLERLGIGRAIRGGKGRLAGRIDWEGSPFELDYDSLDGRFDVTVAAGQFLKVEPGVARLLGVLSLQTLPRRLTLDFRDLFQRGFAFDSITGDVAIRQGVARTNNLVMRGAQAAVLMEGQADIDRETQDLRVVVVPEINAGTASLAYAVINPAVGLGTFLAQLVLRKPLIQAGTREFQVSGTWDEPAIERVERRFNAPLPDLAPVPLAAEPGASAPVRAELPVARPVR